MNNIPQLNGTRLEVSTQRNPWDRAVKALTLKGFTADVIARRTGLTVPRVRHRQRVLYVSAMDYRRGISPKATELLGRIDKMYDAIASLRRHLNDRRATR